MSRASRPNPTPITAPQPNVSAIAHSGSSSYTLTSTRYTTTSRGRRSAAAISATGNSRVTARITTTTVPSPSDSRKARCEVRGSCGNRLETIIGSATCSCGAAAKCERPLERPAKASVSGAPQRTQKWPSGVSPPQLEHALMPGRYYSAEPRADKPCNTRKRYVLNAPTRPKGDHHRLLQRDRTLVRDPLLPGGRGRVHQLLLRARSRGRE